MKSPSAQDFRLALEKARRGGFKSLADFYEKSLAALEAPSPSLIRTRPKISFVVDHKGWCGERLSQNLISRLPEYDCSIIRLGDKEHLKLDADIYLYRNVSWLNAIPLPEWTYKKVVCLLEGVRPLEKGLAPLYKKVKFVVPLNNDLKRKAEALGVSNILDPIPNGIETSEFYPAEKFPSKFIVGAAGNFSLDYYDEWKGFSKYIVPACEKAGVELSWCGWRGRAYHSKLKGKQVPLHEMNNWYRTLSCFITMSRAEGCSGTTFEAMASGLPVISTKVGWHVENCKDEILWVDRPQQETASSVCNTVNELAETILNLKNHGELCKCLGKSARKFTAANTWDSILPKWKKIFSIALENKNGNSTS